MSDPCSQIERIVKNDTLVGSMVKTLKNLDDKLDKVLEKVGALEGKMETYENRPYANSFVGGVAAAGGLAGVLLWDALKPFAKPIAAVLMAAFK